MIAKTIQGFRPDRTADPTPVVHRDVSLTLRVARVGRRAVLGMALGLCGCRREPMHPSIVAGKAFPCRSAISLEGEPTPDEVVALIGDPLERTRAADGETFRYSVRGRYGDRVRLLGFIRVSEPHYSWSCDVRLEFRDGHLYAITHARTDDGPEGEEKDGPVTRILRPTPGPIER